MEERIIAISKTHGLKIIGPNCMGPYCPSSNLTAWGAIPGLSGSVGIISQRVCPQEERKSIPSTAPS